MSISGKYMEARIGATVVRGNFAWSAEEGAAELDGTTAQDNGFENPDDGLYSLVVNLRGYMDVATGQYVPVRRGTTISNLRLYRNKNDLAPAFDVPVAKVFNSTQGGEVAGKIEWTARVKAKGSYTYNDPA